MVTSNFSYESDFSRVTAEIQNLVREATQANTVFTQLNKTAAAAKMEAARSFAGVADAAGFKTTIVDLTGATENFGQALAKNKLTMREYFKEASQAYKKDSQAYKLAVREVKRAQGSVVAMGDINGRRKGMLITPDALDMGDSKTKMAVAQKQYEVFNDLVNKGSTSLVNWGKNTQWAGRQLTVGLTVPMGIFATKAITAFAELDKQITRFRKVYGSDLPTTVYDSTETILGQIRGLGEEFAKQYGIASSQTVALAADLASAGLEGQTLINGIRQTTRMMVLGEIDRQEAMKATMSLQTAFNMNSKELAQSIDFLNQVENQTSASLQDLTEAIPKAGPVIQSLGGDVKDLSVLMTALREGGIASAEGANALKSGMASLISPTNQAIKVARQFGIDLEGVVTRNKGELMPMLLDFQDQLRGLDDFGKAKLIEEIFGKYQFARISALFDNLNQRGSQTVGMIQLMDKSADDLAKQSYSELMAQQNAPSTRLAAIQQQLTEQLIKIGAEMAESVLPPLQQGLDILSKIVDGFNNLPAPLKSFAKIFATVVSVAGPLMMLAGMFGNLVGNTIKFGMSIINLFKRITGNPVQQLQILSDQEMAAKIAADQLTNAYYKQKTSVDAVTKSLSQYVALLRQAAAVAPPGAVLPGGRGPLPPIRRRHGGIIYAQNGMTDGRINGYGGGDKVPALLEPGEFVINKESSKKFAPLLRSINDGSYGQFNEGFTPLLPGENRVNLKTNVGISARTMEAAISALDDETRRTFEKVLVNDKNVQGVLDKLHRANIPGFMGVEPKDIRFATGTDRAHFASLQNLLMFTDEADKAAKFATSKEFLFTTVSDNTGVNQLVANLGKDSVASLEKSLGYETGQLSKIIKDTRPLIVNKELREFFSKIENGLLGDDVKLKTELSKTLFMDSTGKKYSSNKAAKVLGALTSNGLVSQYAGDSVATRKILEAQLKHSIAQTATVAEWEKIKSVGSQYIDELVDMMMDGKPLSPQKLQRIKEMSAAMTNRRLLDSREQLIIKEFRNNAAEMSRLTAEERALLQSIPNSEKNRLIKELNISGRIGVSATDIASPKGKGAISSRDAGYARKDRTFQRISGKSAGIMSEAEFAASEAEKKIRQSKNPVLKARVFRFPLRRRNGGSIPGYGGGDIVPAMLEPGEFVINKEATRANMPLLEQINGGMVRAKQDGGMIRGYQNGGLVAQTSGMMMNLMFLPMMFEQAKASEGMMQKLLYAVVAIQGILGVIQTIQLAKSAMGKITAARDAKGLSTGLGATLRGAGAKDAMKAAGGARSLSGLATFATTAAIPLAAVAATVAIIGFGIYKWRQGIDEAAKATANMYAEATEMAKVYNIEINTVNQSLNKMLKDAASLGQATINVGRGAVDKDYASAVTKQYGDSIERIKSLNSEQEKLNSLSTVYSSLILQGFTPEQAKETTAEIARQADATQTLNSSFDMMTNNTKDAASAMKVLVDSTLNTVESSRLLEVQVEAIGGAYTNLVRLAADEPLLFQANIDALLIPAMKQTPAAVRKAMEKQIAELGLGGKNSKALEVLAGINFDSKAGRQAGLDFMNAITNQMDPAFIQREWDEATQSFSPEFYAELQLNIATRQAKEDLNADMETFISQIEDQIDATNAYYDEKIDLIEKEKEAIQKSHEEQMENIEKQNEALGKRKDIIEENADFYISQLEKEYAAESYYQKQRETQLGGLQSLSQGDIFGYLQSQQQSASDAAQFGREQAIQQIEDTKDAAIKALDGQIKANQEIADKADESFNDKIEDKDDAIESLNQARSAAVKGLKDLIDQANAIIDLEPGEQAAGDLQKLEDKAVEVGAIVPPKVKTALLESSTKLVENLDTNIKTITDKLAAQYGLTPDEAFALYMSSIGVFNPKSEVQKPSNVEQGIWNKLTAGEQQTVIQDILGNAAENSGDFEDNSKTDKNRKDSGIYYVKKTSKDGMSYEVWKNKNGKFTKLPGFFRPTDYPSKSHNVMVMNLPDANFNRGGRVKPMMYNSGMVNVPGFGYSDKVHALLTPGETVVDKIATQRNKYTLAAMNAGISFDRPNTNSYGTLGEREIEVTKVNMGGVNININANNMTPAQLETSVIRALDKAATSIQTSFGGNR